MSELYFFHIVLKDSFPVIANALRHVAAKADITTYQFGNNNFYT